MVDFTIDENIGVIAMDDGKANAFSFAALEAINKALDEANEKDVAAVVIQGREGMFSGGFDLNVMRGGNIDDITRILEEGQALLLRIMKEPRPVVAACSGHAIAMGLFTLLACDARIGATGAFKLGANETAIGMPLPVFGVELPRARIDRRAFHKAVAHAHMFSPEEAADVGILDQAVAPEALLSTATEIAQQLGAMPRGSYAANKGFSNAPAIKLIEAKR